MAILDITKRALVALMIPTALTLSACGGGAQPEAASTPVSTPAESATPSAAAPSSETPTPEPPPPPPPPPPAPTVTLHDCYDVDYNDLDPEIVINLDSPDAGLSKIWPMKLLDCDKVTRTKGDFTDREKKALAASRYD